MATIYCFTSTGNSLYAANMIADRIGGQVLPMRGRQVACEDDVIGFVFPCFFWGLPRIVGRFVSNIQITNRNAYVFAIITCGGPSPGTHVPLVKALNRKGIRLNYGESIVCVTNYIPEYNAEDSEALCERVEAQIHRITGDIINRKEKRFKALPLLSRLIYKSYPDKNSDRYFSVATTCNGCKICMKVCPANNITLQDGKLEFHHNCEHCLACLHNCPASAIDWKEKTQGKKRYRNAKISLGDLVAFNNR